MTVDEYYNNFYKELSIIDNKHNNFGKIERWIPKPENINSIIDIGCGYGGVCEDLIKKGVKVVAGIEINEEAIKKLNEKGFITYKRDLNQKLKIDSRFEIVCLLDVLEHVYQPLELLKEAADLAEPRGIILINVPLYFDLSDRLRILFTGNIVSYDNSCYGEEIRKRFRSYNYDHIRFFQPNEVIEMCQLTGLHIESIEYTPMFGGRNIILKILRKLIANKYTVDYFPTLLAHFMFIKARKAN